MEQIDLKQKVSFIHNSDLLDHIDSLIKNDIISTIKIILDSDLIKVYLVDNNILEIGSKAFGMKNHSKKIEVCTYLFKESDEAIYIKVDITINDKTKTFSFIDLNVESLYNIHYERLQEQIEVVPVKNWYDIMAVPYQIFISWFKGRELYLNYGEAEAQLSLDYISKCRQDIKTIIDNNNLSMSEFLISELYNVKYEEFVVGYREKQNRLF